MVLNKVWSIESPYNAAVLLVESASFTTKPSAAGFGRPKASMMCPTKLKNGLNKIKAHITPNKLKIVCDKAARFAGVLPTDAAMLAVIVVPMFSPSTIAHAMLKGIQPMLNMMRVIAIVADDD